MRLVLGTARSANGEPRRCLAKEDGSSRVRPGGAGQPAVWLGCLVSGTNVSLLLLSRLGVTAEQVRQAIAQSPTRELDAMPSLVSRLSRAPTALDKLAEIFPQHDRAFLSAQLAAACTLLSRL